MAVNIPCPGCRKPVQIKDEPTATGVAQKCPACGAELTVGSVGGLAFAPEVLKTAMKAFKKRLKLAQLDEESTIGHGPFSQGGASGIFAVRPPDQFGQPVWEELIRKGLLRRAAAGLLELVEPGKK